MKTKLYPDRKLCKKCGKKLLTVVLDGLYCSYKCANVPIPSKNINDVPRECKTQRENKWVLKRKFRYKGEIPTKIINDPSTNVYNCNYCHFLHIGHDRPLGNETSRIIRDFKTLGETFMKIREQRNETKKYVASKINVRPIRITEIEEAHVTVDMNVVFKLAEYYRIKITVLF